MAIQILEAMCIHKPVVLRFVVSGAASGDRFTHCFIDLRPTLARQAYQHFRTFGGIANFIRRKGFELVMNQQHDENVIAYDHAGSGFVGKLGIEGEAELGKKLYGLIEIFYRQIDENFSGHVVLP
jgi:hypothetical protein